MNLPRIFRRIRTRRMLAIALAPYFDRTPNERHTMKFWRIAGYIMLASFAANVISSFAR